MVHGLAAGPEGECVVCLREARSHSARRATRWSAAVAVAVLGICGAVLTVRSLRAQAARTAQAARVAAQSNADAEQQAREARAGRLPNAAEILAAWHATPVLMFSTSWCPVCDHARRFFRANDIPFVDKDIESDAAAAAELKRRTGRNAIPVIEIDGQQLQPGFGEQVVLQAVVSSVERRLDIGGLNLVTPPRTNL